MNVRPRIETLESRDQTSTAFGSSPVVVPAIRSDTVLVMEPETADERFDGKYYIVALAHVQDHGGQSGGYVGTTRPA